MNNYERQDLVYFWTSSPALPASEEGFQVISFFVLNYYIPISHIVYVDWISHQSVSVVNVCFCSDYIGS